MTLDKDHILDSPIDGDANNVSRRDKDQAHRHKVEALVALSRSREEIKKVIDKVYPIETMDTDLKIMVDVITGLLQEDPNKRMTIKNASKLLCKSLVIPSFTFCLLQSG